MKRYNELWTKTVWLRSDYDNFRQSIRELQAELAREVREVLWVSERVKLERRDD